MGEWTLRLEFKLLRFCNRKLCPGNIDQAEPIFLDKIGP